MFSIKQLIVNFVLLKFLLNVLSKSTFFMQSNTAYGNKTGSEALYTAEYYFNLFFYHRQTVCFNLKHCCQ